MGMVKFRFYWNSTNFHRDASGSFNAITPHPEHIPAMDGFRIGNQLTLAHEGELPITADKRGCKYLWKMFNAPFERPVEYAGPSMSVGDVIVFFPDTPKQIAFAVEPLGFKEADIRDSQLMSRPERWVRSHFELREYLRYKELEVGLTPDERNFLEQ